MTTMSLLSINMIKGRCGGMTRSRSMVAQSVQQQISEVSIVKPDDWHLHLRDGKYMESAVIHSAARFGRAIIMPNLVPPITTVQMAMEYKQRIMTAIQKHQQKVADCEGMDQLNRSISDFQPLMTLYMTDSTSCDEIDRAKSSGIMGVKLYPAGATTNSDSGVTDINKVYPTLQHMAKIGLPLLVHGEVTSLQVDMFDREKQFLQQVLKPLMDKLPDLKIVLEHVSTREAVEFVMQGGERIAATVTPQHLLFNRNAIFNKGLNPHHFCLPILKREEHRLAVLEAATRGSSKFFLGTDSAPHTVESKECSCGCAGIFNASVALSVYLEMFEQMQAVQNFEKFASLNGPRFYGLQPNKERIKLVRDTWRVPHSYEFGDSVVIPLRAEENLQWRLS
eukprot:TRINITY_DN10561_c0_g1_i2.p1 TRINITY_DN10561_c0_g1~~TRINITY_DN10561_c0_g1_i2.p1  ORF type:complete len:401 (-),score=63.08 TRINITY_DN10561_c0_g1_i2:138-1316(-)